MAAVYILIFGEIAGFKIVPFIAMHMKMIFFFHGAMKNFSANQNSPICIKTTDIKLYHNEALHEGVASSNSGRRTKCR